MRRKDRIIALALALLLALAPAASALDEPAASPDGQDRKILKYIACAGSIVFMVASPMSIFFTTLVCVDAFTMDD